MQKQRRLQKKYFRISILTRIRDTAEIIAEEIVERDTFTGGHRERKGRNTQEQHHNRQQQIPFHTARFYQKILTFHLPLFLLSYRKHQTFSPTVYNHFRSYCAAVFPTFLPVKKKILRCISADIICILIYPRTVCRHAHSV